MSGVKCRKWILKSHFSGVPKREDMDFVEEEIPALKDGEFLCEAIWLSVDPYMRGFSAGLPLGSIMLGEQVAKVIQSKNSQYSVGDTVTAMFGWTTHAVCDEAKAKEAKVFKVNTSVVPADKLSYALGVLGMPGATAYIALHNICKPKEGETLLVNAAAGAVGSLVGQIAKIRGCKAVGFAGSDAKLEYLKSLGFDVASNYKTGPLKEAVDAACPEGVDMFFDHVGGDFHSTVVQSMRTAGRVAIVGGISEYNRTDEKKVGSLCLHILSKQVTITGFMVYNHFDQWGQAFKEMRGWIDEGKLKVKESVTEGFENMFDAFLGLFKGENVGKAVVKA